MNTELRRFVQIVSKSPQKEMDMPYSYRVISRVICSAQHIPGI